MTTLSLRAMETRPSDRGACTIGLSNMPHAIKAATLLLFGMAMCTLAACQNTAGAVGTVPSNCAVPGSSCSRT